MGKKLISLFLAIIICVSAFPLSIFAASTEASASTEAEGRIIVSNTQAFAGSTVTLNVDIADNPGIAGAKILVYYNAKLTLTSASVGETFAELDYTAPPALANGCAFNWDSLDQEVTKDGTLLTLTFDISNSATANEKLDVAVSYTYGDIYNKELDSLSFEVTNGYVKIIDYIPGDVNGDQTINGKDVTLIRRHNAGYEVTLNKLAADVNNDGTINGKDVTLIRRKNAGYEVELLPSTPKCDHSLTSVAAKEATCTENGNNKYWVCSECNKYFSDENAVSEITLLETVISASGHTTIAIPEIAPSCTKMGKTEGSLCTSCNTILTSQSDIPTIGHNYVSGICSECGDKEDKTVLEVTSVSVDKTLLMANDQVTFSAVANKDSNNIAFTVVIYLNGVQVETLSDKGNVKYIPTASGRYDAEVSVTDDGENIFTYYLKSCFEVKSYWCLNQITESSNNVSLGNLLTFNAQIDGDVSDLSYNITVYKDGASYYSIENNSKVDFYPNVAGTYYAVITVTDGYGETQTAQSGTVVVKAQNTANPTLNINYGTTLNIDELNGKDGDEIIVPVGENIILNWNKLSTDSYYRLDVYACNNDSDTYDEVFKNYTSNSYTISSSNLISGHEYCATVRRYDASGNSLGNIRVAFTVGGANSIMLEKRFEVTSPVDDGVYAQNDITVQWTKLNYASKYVLSLEYHCGKSYHDVLENIEISNTQNSYTIPKSILHQGCKHRLKVYAYDALGNELYESIIFRMAGDEAIYELDYPEITNSNLYDDWDINMKTYPVYEDIEITWTKVPAAAYYIVSVDSGYSSVDDPIIVGADHVESNSFIIPIELLVGGCEYSIQVSACCEDGHKKTSDEKNFRAPYSNGTVLDPPVITSHELSTDSNDPTVIVEQALTFEWAPVSAASTYSVYWCEIGWEDSPEYELKNITAKTVTIPTDAIYASSSKGYTDFRLEIVAKDSNKMWVNTYYYVRIVKSSLETPVIISPTLATDDEETLPSFEDDITLTWNAVEGAVSYKVRVWECYDGDLFELISQDGITETSFDIPLDELYFGGVFRISIRANDQYGGSSKSSKYYFQVGESDYLGLSVDNWNPAYEADYKFTYVETVGDWTAKTSASWITLSSTSGTGTTRLKVSVTENTESSARSGRITFTNADGGTAVFSITQDANNSSQTSVIQIVSPSQNEVVENDMLTVKWTVKYGYAYFELDLFDLTNDKAVYHQSDITALYQQIPASYIEQGHTYQLTLSIFDYSENKGAETSIIFKVEGDIIPPDDDTDNDNTDDSETIPTTCVHDIYKKQLLNTVYSNLIKNDLTHYGYHIYRKVCLSCSQAFEDETVYFSNQTHSLNNNGYCECGYIDTTNYTACKGINTAGKTIVVYQNPQSTAQYGSISALEEVTILGECCGKYLIQYNLDDGSGIKQGYVSTNYIGNSISITSAAIYDSHSSYNKNKDLEVEIGYHNYDSGFDLMVNSASNQLSWYVYSSDNSIAGTYMKNGKVYIHAYSAGTVGLYISHIYAKSFSELDQLFLYKICEIDVSEPNSSQEIYDIKNQLAVAIMQPYYSDYLDAANGYDNYSGSVVFLMELMANGIFGTGTTIISDTVKNMDKGIDNGREIVNQMVFDESFKLNTDWLKFTKEITSLSDNAKKNFSTEQAQIMFMISQLSDSEFVTLMDGDQNNWAQNSKLKELWMFAGDEILKDDNLIGEYRTVSKSMGVKSLNILSKAGKVVSTLGKGLNLFEKGAGYFVLYLYQDEINAMIDTWIEATDDVNFKAELIKYKNTYNSTLGVALNTITDSGFLASEIQDIIPLMAKAGLFGAGVKGLVAKLGTSKFTKTINQVDTFLMLENFILKYFLDTDVAAACTAIKNTMAIDPIYRQEIEAIIGYHQGNSDFDDYIKDIQLAGKLAKLELTYYVEFFENSLIVSNESEEARITKIIDGMKNHIEVIDNYLDVYVNYLIATGDVDAAF